MYTPAQLTPRQSEIVHLAMDGKSNKEIAKELGISDYTVRDLLSHVMRKLNVSRRGELRFSLQPEPANGTAQGQTTSYPIYALRTLTFHEQQMVNGGVSCAHDEDAHRIDEVAARIQPTVKPTSGFAYHIKRILGILHL